MIKLLAIRFRIRLENALLVQGEHTFFRIRVSCTTRSRQMPLFYPATAFSALPAHRKTLFAATTVFSRRVCRICLVRSSSLRFYSGHGKAAKRLQIKDDSLGPKTVEKNKLPPPRSTANQAVRLDKTREFIVHRCDVPVCYCTRNARSPWKNKTNRGFFSKAFSE